jgi:hypothetical protein
MKKIIFAAVALIFSVSMFAQGPQRREFKPEDMATRMADGMKKELSLNDKQYKSVFKLYLKQGEEMKARREKEQGQQIDREARREEMKKSQEAMNAELKKILTAEQYTKYEEMLKKQQQRQHQGGPRGPQGDPGRPGGQGMGAR